ncbi:MAG: MFS transporter [Actinomycetales bacterium]
MRRSDVSPHPSSGAESSSPDEQTPSSAPSDGGDHVEYEHGQDPRRWKALTVCLVAGFMSLLDVSIVNVALPSIATGINAGQSALEWIVSGYALAFGLLLVPAGRLGDARGRRLVFVCGVGLFTLASLLCGLAPSAGILVAARLLQGIAGGLFQPQIAALIQGEFAGQERRKAFGLFGATVGISTAIGPLLGGLLISIFGQEEGWRGIFWVNVPIGIVAVPLALRLLPRDKSGRRQSLDPVGVLLLAAGVLLLLLPLVEGRSLGWPWWAWVVMACSLPVLAIFFAWERHHRAVGKAPLVDTTLFRVRSYTTGMSLATTYFAGFTGLFFILTLYYQQGHGYSALVAGASTIPFALSSALGSAVSSRITARIGPRVVVIGLVLVVIGLAATWFVVHLADGPGMGWKLIAPLIVAGTGSGLVIAPNQELTLSEVPRQGAGSAAGVLQTGQRVGSAIGLALIATVFFSAATAGQSRPDWATGFQVAVVICVVLCAAALGLSFLDRGRASDA